MDKILVIDDEKPTLTMFRLLLGAQGYDVLTAENGREGLEVFERERPPLVLTDIKMPGMDGIEVLRQIKLIDPRTEVVVITGHGDMELAIKALSLDAADFINKPIQRHILEQALQRARERIQLHVSQEKQVWTEVEGDAAVIWFRGSMTAASESRMVDGFKEAFSLNRECLVLRFDPNVSFNGAGISILTQQLLEAAKRGCRVTLAGLPDNFRKVFRLVGITRLVDGSEAEDDV
ncbi:MAG: response regulator [Syntrophobacteraceae bacterium]|jgi:YesN/AraC family two-component response regulator|nr:response regulator [Syntrophobacteraceae bacterium]